MHFKRYCLGLAICFGAAVACDDSSSQKPIVYEDCLNGFDDDDDGQLDCYDTDCAWHIACQVATPEDCANGRDDDDDGYADCYDFDCRDDPACQGLSENCVNRIDDDADELIDCADPDCSPHSACLYSGEYCDNHEDDDGDGLIDCADPECVAYSACLPPLEDCDNNLDDDGDGLMDCDDPDCAADPDCFNNTSATCGNGTIDYGEECDTWNLNGFYCEDLGYHGGYLYCSAQCSFSLSGCFLCGNGFCEAGENQVNCPADCNGLQFCGNGVVNFDEECDNSNLNGKTCISLNTGYSGGTLRCSSYCLFDTSACYYCGNYICEAGENLSNCQVDCQFAVNCGNGICESGETVSNCPSDCYGNGVCGNGVIESGEQCDGSNFGGKTCLTYGYTSGTLFCYSNCQANLSACSSGSGEICNNNVDDNGNGAIDCMDDACWTDPNCRPIVCGDNICDPGETAAICPEDCDPDDCPSNSVLVSRLTSAITIYGATDICGNGHGDWQPLAVFYGTAIVFNVLEDSNYWVSWVGTSCSTATLNWALDFGKLEISADVGSVHTCWAICTPSGPNFCCVLGTDFPATCGDGNTPKVWINSWLN